MESYRELAKSLETSQMQSKTIRATTKNGLSKWHDAIEKKPQFFVRQHTCESKNEFSKKLKGQLAALEELLIGIKYLKLEAKNLNSNNQIRLSKRVCYILDYIDEIAKTLSKQTRID